MVSTASGFVFQAIATFQEMQKLLLLCTDGDEATWEDEINNIMLALMGRGAVKRLSDGLPDNPTARTPCSRFSFTCKCLRPVHAADHVAERTWLDVRRPDGSSPGMGGYYAAPATCHAVDPSGVVAQDDEYAKSLVRHVYRCTEEMRVRKGGGAADLPVSSAGGLCWPMDNRSSPRRDRLTRL